MSADPLDARSLFRVAPGDYVSERTRLVKAAKAAGNKADAAAYQALKRPNLPMWAVLAAADDDAVRFLVTATAEVAHTQAAGGNSGAIATAMRHRKTAIDALVDRAVDALGQWDASAMARRGEIRSHIDQLSRQGDLVDSWLDGTLRDLPDDSLGFTSFAEMALPARTSTGTKRPAGKRTATPKVVPVPQLPPKPASETAEQRAARAERVACERQARKDIAAASRELITATRRVETATAALQAAEEALHNAEAERADVIRRRTEAEAVLADGQDHHSS